MGEAEIFETVRSTNAQIVALYAQFISINFAAIAGIYLFLNRATLPLKLVAFGVYLVGSLMFVGLMLEESNIKRVALAELAALPAGQLSGLSSGLLALHDSWLFNATAILLNAGLWILILGVGWLMFVWRKPDVKLPG
ncbi:MAG: hypothetical protein QM773_04760 [Hyphomonadaceae bacterium]